MLLHFAYGSNMDRALMRAHCPSAQPLGTARLGDYRFLIARAGYASLEPSAGASVSGVVWRLAPADLAALDRYESVETGLYEHAIVCVRLRGRSAKALAYIACDAAPGVPRAGYVELVLRAARLWRLPDRYVHELARWMMAASVQGATA